MAMNPPVKNFASEHRLRYELSTDGAGGGTATILNATLMQDTENGPLREFLNKTVANDAEADAYCEDAAEFEIVAHTHTVDIITVTPVEDGTGKLGFEVAGLVANAESHVTFWFVHSILR